jgi:hypothetical protein
VLYTLTGYHKQINFDTLRKSIEALIPYTVRYSYEDHDWIVTSTMVQPLIDFVRWIYTGSPELDFLSRDLRPCTPDTHLSIKESIRLTDNIRLKFHGNLLYMDFRSSEPYTFVYRIHGNMILSVFPPPPSPFTNLPVDYWVNFVSDIPGSIPDRRETSWVL